MTNSNAAVMTWPEIIQNYPSQWVGLVDVCRKENNTATIKSARVKYTGIDKLDLISLSLESDENVTVKFTEPDKILQLGALSYV